MIAFFEKCKSNQLNKSELFAKQTINMQIKVCKNGDIYCAARICFCVFCFKIRTLILRFAHTIANLESKKWII